MRFAEISKTVEKHCRVLQKSRFGGSRIDDKSSLESKLGPFLTLSLLVTVQGGAKRGKLTLLGVLRGTQLELKGSRGELLECLGRVLGGSWEHFVGI